MSYVVNVNDPSTPTDTQGARQGAEELRAIKLKLLSIVAGGFITSAAGANAADITTFIQPDINDRPAMVAGGWLPWNLNQQWGGAGCTPFHLLDAATDVEYKFDAFDAYIEDDGYTEIGVDAARYYQYQVITPAKNLSLQALWLKVYKVLNPIDNLTVQLWSVAAGVPNALIATANTINGKQITSDANGQWYRFSFAVVQALAAGTQYMIVAFKSAGVDVNNYYNWKGKAAATRYPNNLRGTGTVAPAWTPANTISKVFICEAQASDQPIQTAGTFTGRIVGTEGNPINRSVGWIKPLREFFPLFNPNGWSILLRGKSWTKDRTICEVIYGLHHDRINIRSATGTGFTTVTIYKQDGTVLTITGTSDISAATYKDVMIVGRSMGDGGDYCKIYTGIAGVWTKEIEATGQTYTFDPLMLKQGHAWIMGGFQLFNNANYTKLSDMGVLPSADGWTFTGSATEGSVFAVSGGKLNQIKAGNTGAQDGYYNKAAAGFSNANGWMFYSKLRVVNNTTNTKDESSVELRIKDGTKQWGIRLAEFFIQSAPAALGAYPQLDTKSTDITLLCSGKGSDTFLVVNGKLIMDAVSQMTTGTATNDFSWGDTSVTATENSDVVWDNVGYYSTANIYPQFTSGELHEFAVFSGDKNLLGQALYNVGVPLSAKQYCGINKNYISDQITQKLNVSGITSGPTMGTVWTTLSPLPEMEQFVIGSDINAGLEDTVSNTITNFTIEEVVLDGNNSTTKNYSGTQTGNGQLITNVTNINLKTNFGLHKVEGRWAVQGGVSTSNGTVRRLRTETKAYV